MKPIRVWGDYPYSTTPPTLGAGGYAGGYQYPAFGITYMSTTGTALDANVMWMYATPLLRNDFWLSSGQTLPKNKWVRWEIFADGGTPGVTNGSLYLWQDGKLIKSGTGVQALPVGYRWTQIFLGHYFERDSYGANALEWWDDAYIDNTRARVELSDSATWAGATHREIQISSLWSASDISIALNLGSFSVSDTLYLYVVDADGNVNSAGYPLAKAGQMTAPTITGITIK